MQYNLPNLRLEPHATARSKASASTLLPAGSIVVSTAALSTTLIASEKGRRCDYCHLVPAQGRRLSKCSGCAAYWYCGTICQTKQWHAHHRKLCKRYNNFTANSSYQELSTEQRVDAILLSQSVTEIFPQDDFDIPAACTRSALVSQFFDLLKRTENSRGIAHLPLCRSAKSAEVPQGIVKEVLSRFGNNNFIVHSHLSSYAHGIFPLASRLFNHSCAPNCAAKFIITPTETVRMEVVALRDIVSGEELTVPYLDPALPLESRQRALQVNYDFACDCGLCSSQKAVGIPPPLPANPENMRSLETKLCEFVAAHVFQLDPGAQPPANQGRSTLEDYPPELLSLFGEHFLPTLSEGFSRTSHEGPYELALSHGRTLLALYILLYPPNYPQIGMHALELTKTAWNAIIAGEQSGLSPSAVAIKRLEDAARHYLKIASQVLYVYGSEGDEGGPLEELRIMRSFLYAHK